MATFIPTSNSRVGKTGYTGFTPTKNAGYKQSTLFGWQQQNKAALDILNRYNERIKSGGWMSTDDRASYKAALDSYTYSSKALRKASEFYGATYTPEERNSWKNSFSQMNNDYNSMNDFYNQFGDETSYGYYAKRWSNDFEENSKYVSTRYGDPHLNIWSGTYDDTGFSDIEYDYINKNTVASDIKLTNDVVYGSTVAGTDNTERLQMTDDEIKIFNYIYKTEGKDKAYEYVSYLESDLNARQRQATQEAWAKYAEEKPFEASAFSILTSPIKGISYIGQTADFIDDGKIDQNAGYNKYSHINSAIRNQVTQDIAATKWGEIGSFAYQTGMSMGDFLFNTAITGGNQALSLALMGTSAAADTTIAAKDRGLEDWQAFTLGTVAGAAEIVTEKIGLDALFDTASLGKNALGYVIKNALAEGGEEVGSSVINLLTDTIVSGDKSYWKTAINGYMSRGADEKTAFWRAVGEQALSLGADFLGGAISGGVMGGVGAGIHSAGVAIEGSKIKNGSISNPSLLTDVALSYDPSNIYAQKMQNKVAKGGELSNYQVGKLAGQIQSGMIEQDTAKIKSAAESRLAELGETGDISAIADALTKQVKGEELSQADRKVLDESKALEERSNGKIVRTSTVAERVANELNRENIQSGQYSSAWAEGIGTKRVNADVYNRRESNNTPARENTTGATSSTTSGPPSPRGRKIAANVLVRNAEGKAVKAEIQGVEVEGDKATFTLSNGEKVSEDKVTFRTESEELVAKLATTKVSRVQGFTTEAAMAMIKGYDGSISPSEYNKAFTEAFEMGRQGDDPGLIKTSQFASKIGEQQAMTAYALGEAETERFANLSEREASREHITEFSKKYGEQARAAIEAYEDGQDVVEYESGYDRAFEKAKSGLDFSYIENSEDTAYLTEAQKKTAYEAGVKYADFVARQQAKNITTQTAENTTRRKGAVKGEGVKIADLRKAFNDTQNRAYKVLSRIAEATGIDIVLYKSEVDANGNYQGAQGKFKWSNDKIYIDLNAGLNNVKDTGSLANYTMLRTFSHEFSHFIEKHDPMMYNELRRTVFSELTARGSNVEALIAAKQGDMDIDNASREVVAEALTDILPDSHFVEILAQKNPSALKKISTKLKEFVSNVKSYFASIKPNSAIEAEALKEERDGVVHYVESIIDTFDKAAVSAVENYQNNGGNINATRRTEQHQERGSDQTTSRSDEGTLSSNRDGRGVSEEVGEKTGIHKDTLWLRRQPQEISNIGRYFPEDSYIKPQKGSVEEAEGKTLEEYGIEWYVVKKDKWTIKAPAWAYNGIVYMVEGIEDKLRGAIARHEATHIMKQLGYKPYLDFVERTPEAIDMSTESARDLVGQMAESYKIDMLKATEFESQKVYDELNSALYGDYNQSYKDEEYLELVNEAMYDYEGHMQELSAIHEQFKADLKAGDKEQRQEREEYSLDNRSLLVNALESATQNEIEAKKLREYRANIKGLNEQSEKLVELKSELKELSFSKGPRDMARIKELREEIQRTENRINLYDKRLLNLEATKALRDVITRETQKAYKKAEQKGKEALRAQRERAETKLNETRKQYQEARARNVEGRHKTEIRHKIKGLKGKFISMLEHPTERQYVPADLVSAMVEVCKLVDTDAPLYKADGSINKAQQARNEQMQRLLKLSDEYKALKNNPDPMYSREYDEEIQEYLDDLRREFLGKPISDMTLGELNELYQTMRAVEETLRDARKLIGWGDAESVYDAGDRIIAEQKDITVKRKGKGENSTKAKFIDLSLSPLRNVKRMANYEKGSPLVKMFRELELGVRNKNKFVMEAHKSFEELTSGSNAKKYEDAVYKPFGKEYVDKEGRKFHVSKMQMMQAIMSYNRELENDKLHHVSDGGFTFADLDMLNKGKLGEAIDPKNAHSITIGALLAEQFKAELANDKWAQDYMAASEYFFDVMAKNAINNTNMVLKHRLVATGKKYIPYEVNKDFVVREITSENDIQQTISGYGMLKDIKAGATQPLIITGLNNVLERHIEQVGNIHGLAVPIRNFNKVWNVKSSDGSTTVQEMIGRNWGATGKSVMTQAVKDVQGARIDTQSDLYKKVKGNVISSTFMFNGSVVAKQIGSMFSATSMLRWRDPVRMIANLGYTMANHKKIAAEVDKYTATAWMRRQGLSDAELHTLTTEAKKKGLSRLVSKLPTAINPTKWIAGMDSMVALSLWKYAKQDVAKRTGLKGEALMEAAAEFYDDVIENTQSMTDALHRPEIQKRKDILSDMLGVFKTDLYQGAGQLQDALGECKADPSKENKATLARTVYANVMSACWGSLMTTVFALLRYKVNRYRDDEDDEIDAESWLKVQGADLAADLVSYALPLFGGEIAGSFFAIMNGEKPDSVDNLTLTAVQDLIDAITAVANSAKDGEMPTEAAFNKILTKAGSVLGIPVNNVTRLIEAIRLHAEDFANGELGSFEAGLTKPNATRLYNAYIEGDAVKIERASRLYADEKAIDTALRKALRDNDPRLEEAALARLEGDTDTYWDLFLDVVEEGKFKDELIKAAFEAEYNYHKNKAKEAKERGEEYP